MIETVLLHCVTVHRGQQDHSGPHCRGTWGPGGLMVPQPQLLLAPILGALLRPLEPDLLGKNFSFLFKIKLSRKWLNWPKPESKLLHPKNFPAPKCHETPEQLCMMCRPTAVLSDDLWEDQRCSGGSWGCQNPYLLLEWSWES